MGIYSYRPTINATRDGLNTLFNVQNPPKWDTPYISGSDFKYVAIDSNLLYFTLMGHDIKQYLASKFDFIMRNLRLAFDGTRFRVFQERIEYDNMMASNIYSGASNMQELKRVEEYFRAIRTASINLDNSETQSQHNSFVQKPKMLVDEVKHKEFKSFDNKLTSVKDVTLADVFSESDSGFYSEPKNRISSECNDGLASLVNALNICGITEEYNKKLHIDVNRLGIRSGYSRIDDNKYVEIKTNDPLNDVQLFASERFVLSQSVARFSKYAITLIEKKLIPIFIWDQSVFSVSPLGGNAHFDLIESNTKIRNVNRIYKNHLEPSKYLMALLAIELTKKNFMNIVAVGEGELYCSHLYNLKIVDYVITTDTDALAAGASIIDPINFTVRNTYDFFKDILPERFVKLFSMMLIPFFQGYDYCGGIYKVGTTTVSNFILHLVKILNSNEDKYFTNMIMDAEFKLSNEEKEHWNHYIYSYMAFYVIKHHFTIKISGITDEEMISRLFNLEDFYTIDISKYSIELPINIPVYQDTQMANVLNGYNCRLIYTERFYNYLESFMGIDNKNAGKEIIYNINNTLTFGVFTTLFAQTKFNIQRSINHDIVNTLTGYDDNMVSHLSSCKKANNIYSLDNFITPFTLNQNHNNNILKYFSKYIYYHMVNENNISLSYIYTKFYNYICSVKIPNLTNSFLFMNVMNYNEECTYYYMNNYSSNYTDSNKYTTIITDTHKSLNGMGVQEFLKLNLKNIHSDYFNINIYLLFLSLYIHQYIPQIGISLINIFNLSLYMTIYSPTYYERNIIYDLNDLNITTEYTFYKNKQNFNEKSDIFEFKKLQHEYKNKNFNMVTLNL